jgi:tRNA(Ile)-lysidine synthase
MCQVSTPKAIDELVKRTLSDALTADIGLDSKPLWLVAVSGGLDSVVLLHMLFRFRSVHGRCLVIVHYDHQLRGLESSEDARWVERLCESMGLRCVMGVGDVAAYAKDQGVSIEMAARALRHSFFVDQAHALGTDVLVTAHHADDQLELVCMRWMRGSGPEGLSGMTRFGPSAFDPDLNIWRPLLGLNRSDIEAYAKRHNLSWREDRTNADMEHQRNRVRHLLLPQIECAFGPEALNGILRSADLVAAEHAVVHRAALDWECGVQVGDRFEQLPLAVQRELIKLALIRMGVVPEFEWIERLRQCEEGEVCVLPQGVRVVRLSGFPLLKRLVSSVPPAHLSESQTILLQAGDGYTLFDGMRIKWRIEKGGLPDRKRIETPQHFEVFDADQVGEEVVLRHWQEGDRMHPIGGRWSSKLQDLFVNAKIDIHMRRQLLVAESPEIGIFWVQGFRIGDLFKVTEKTEKLLVWEYESLDSH